MPSLCQPKLSPPKILLPILIFKSNFFYHCNTTTKATGCIVKVVLADCRQSFTRLAANRFATPLCCRNTFFSPTELHAHLLLYSVRRLVCILLHVSTYFQRVCLFESSRSCSPTITTAKAFRSSHKFVGYFKDSFQKIKPRQKSVNFIPSKIFLWTRHDPIFTFLFLP